MTKDLADELERLALQERLSIVDGVFVHDNLPAILSALRGEQGPGVETPWLLVEHLHRQKAFSEKTFGPGPRTIGVVDHIRKELREIEADPANVMEWVDVILLALDGAWRAGCSPEQIVAAIDAKQTRNEGRVWPDWRTADPDKAIEHDRREPKGTTHE